MQETQVRPLGREDPLEEEMATHSSILAGIIPWSDEPGRPQSMHWSVLSRKLKGNPPPADFWRGSDLSALQTLEFGSQTSNLISSI